MLIVSCVCSCQTLTHSLTLFHPLQLSRFSPFRFNTNYHFVVPELDQHQAFKLASPKPLEEYQEAKAQGIETRPVVLGPVSFLMLSKPAKGE